VPGLLSKISCYVARVGQYVLEGLVNLVSNIPILKDGDKAGQRHTKVTGQNGLSKAHL
jgi:hypothetical protein